MSVCPRCHGPLGDDAYYSLMDGRVCAPCGIRHNVELDEQIAKAQAACRCTAARHDLQCDVYGHGELAAQEITERRNWRRRQ